MNYLRCINKNAAKAGNEFNLLACFLNKCDNYVNFPLNIKNMFTWLNDVPGRMRGLDLEEEPLIATILHVANLQN